MFRGYSDPLREKACRDYANAPPPTPEALDSVRSRGPQTFSLHDHVFFEPQCDRFQGLWPAERPSSRGFFKRSSARSSSPLLLWRKMAGCSPQSLIIEGLEGHAVSPLLSGMKSPFSNEPRCQAPARRPSTSGVVGRPIRRARVPSVSASAPSRMPASRVATKPAVPSSRPTERRAETCSSKLSGA